MLGPMRTMLAGLGAGCLGAAAGWLLGRASPPVDGLVPPMTESPVSTRTAAESPRAPAAMSFDTDQLAALTERIAALEAKLDQLPARLLERAPVDGRTADAAIDGEALLAAMERATARRERAKLDVMTDAELLQEGRRLARDGHDYGAARKALALLLERPLEAKDRAAAMTELGIVDRDAGNLASSAEVLQKTMDMFGADTAEGAWAGFQLMWTVRGQSDATRAMALAEGVAAATGAGEPLRLHGRWHAAQLAEELGNQARARAEYAAIVREYDGRSEYSVIVDDCKRRLGQ